MAILDHNGNPVNTSKLTNELATPSVGGVRQAFHETISDVTPEKLATILLAVDQGDSTEYLTLAEQMEERDPHYSSVLRTRKLAVSALTIGVDAASDDKRDVEIADAVTNLTKQQKFRNLMADQLDALGKGYSVSEIMWDKSGKLWRPKSYQWRDQRWFMFDRATGRELRLRDEADAANGLPLEPYKFSVHYPQLKTGLPIRGGLARLVVVSFMCKSFALKDWMVFAEVFGMPLRLGKYGTSATSEQKSQLLRALTSIGTDAAAMIPEGMEIEFATSTSGTGGDKLFPGLAEYIDSQVSKAVLGQTMTTDNGSSMSQANVHNEVRGDLRDDDAMKLAATLHRDVIRPFVDLNFGPPKDEAYPTLRLFKEEQEDLESLSKSLPPFINLGLKVEASVIRDKFNLPEPEEGAEVLGPATPAVPPPAPLPSPNDLQQTRRQAAAVLTQRILDGVELTNDQRAFLGLAAQQKSDPIDELIDESLDDWRKVVSPVLDPVLEMANNATSFEALLKALKNANLNTDQLVQSLATATFKSRGLGDAGGNK